MKDAIVLFPYGQPADESDRKVLEPLVFHCGGDIHRFIDGPVDTLEHFASYVSRIAEIGRAGTRAMVVITETKNPSISVLRNRQLLSEQIPSLKRALWVVFAGSGDIARMLAFAREFGRIEDELGEESRIWVTNSGEAFLLLSPSCRDVMRLKERVKSTLDIVDMRATGTRRSPSSGSSASFKAVVPPSFPPSTPPKEKP